MLDPPTVFAALLTLVGVLLGGLALMAGHIWLTEKDVNKELRDEVKSVVTTVGAHTAALAKTTEALDRLPKEFGKVVKTVEGVATDLGETKEDVAAHETELELTRRPSRRRRGARDR